MSQMKHKSTFSFLLSFTTIVISSLCYLNSMGCDAAIISSVKSLDCRYFIAGGVCAATSHGVTTPIDVVKTRMQAQPKVYNKGFRAAMLHILKIDGPFALLGGLGPTIVGYGMEGAVKFGVYELMKPILSTWLTHHTVTAYIVASVFAGAMASIFLCPMECARIRVVTDKKFKTMGLFGALVALVKESGVLYLFAGITAMLSKQVPYTMAKQVSFDVVAEKMYDILSTDSVHLFTRNLKFVVTVVSALVSSISACMLSQPGDMILTEMYKHDHGSNFFDTVWDIYNNKGGISGFFTGTDARVVHVGSIITIQLVLYDIVKQLLGLPATGRA